VLKTKRNPASSIEIHTRLDPHRRAPALADVILGGQDGLVNVLGVALGVAAAAGDAHLVLVAGLAAALAESVSMAAVAYTATRAEADLYESERAREYRHVRSVPELEADEIRQIYRAKGFEGGLLDRIVATITADPDVWVAVMMAEEHQLAPIGRHTARRSALVVGVAAVAGSLIPLAPFLWLPVGLAMWTAIGLAALVLFVVGAFKARLTLGHPVKSGLEMALIGTASALVGFGVGVLFRLPVNP
jgi:vacuolar iron transporter family protein